MVNKEWMDQMTSMGQSAMGSMMRMQQISTSVIDRLAQQQMGLINEATAGGMKQMDVLGKMNSPQEMASGQTETATAWMEKLMENGRQNMTILTEAQAELSKLMDEVVTASTKSAGSK